MIFKTKSAETKYFRAMLGKYNIGQRINDEDYKDLVILLQKHDDCKRKTGCGITAFSVVMTKQGTKCFNIIRPDCSSTEFSYLHCIRNLPLTKKTEVIKSFREIVFDDIQEFKNNAFAWVDKIKCGVTGELISRNQAHVDHAVPATFQYIVDCFMDDRKLEYKDIEIVAPADNQTFTRLIDDKLAGEFRAYHQRVCQLRIVKAEVNLGLLRKKNL